MNNESNNESGKSFCKEMPTINLCNDKTETEEKEKGATVSFIQNRRVGKIVDGGVWMTDANNSNEISESSSIN